MDEVRLNEILKKKKEEAARAETRTSIIKEYLIVENPPLTLGIQIEYLREVFDIRDPADVVPVPFTPDYLTGIINVRGEIIPVISLDGILGGIRENSCRKMVVLEENFKIAFPVVEVIDLLPLDINQIKEIKNLTRDRERIFLNGEFDHEGKRVFIIDILKLTQSGLMS